jgi:hypothetical protein
MDPRASGEDPVGCVHRGERLFGVRSSTSVQTLPAYTRRRRSLPPLKKAVDVPSTETDPPFLGLRPTCASQRLTVKAPKPRRSTRSPRASADAIVLKMVATTVSTSRPRRCGFAAEISAMSPDLVKGHPAISLRSDARRGWPRQHKQRRRQTRAAVLDDALIIVARDERKDEGRP